MLQAAPRSAGTHRHRGPRAGAPSPAQPGLTGEDASPGAAYPLRVIDDLAGAPGPDSGSAQSVPAAPVPAAPGPAAPGPAAPSAARAGDLLATALTAFALLAELGETVEDEWIYVTKLVEVGRARLRAAVPDAAGRASPESAAAIDALAAEAGRITDPHRAIDWLSTFPAVAELALGGGAVVDPARPPAGGA